MIAGTLTLRNAKDHGRGDGVPGSLRGSSIPWSTLPPGPEAYVTLVPKARDGTATLTGGGTVLRGSTNPNYSSTLTRGRDGPAPAPLASSLHHGEDVLRQPYNNTSTAKNCRDSWEVRTRGGQAARGTDAPWDSMRRFTAPPSSLPPGPGWTYATRDAPDITSTSTASTNVASWTTRLDSSAAPGALLGSRNPNATMRVASPSGPVPTSTRGPLSRSVEFNTTSTAENDQGSWMHRRASTAQPRGAGASAAGRLTADSGRPLGATFGSNYQKQRKPDITDWSTAAVDKDSWEHRVHQSFPNHLTFTSTQSNRLAAR